MKYFEGEEPTHEQLDALIVPAVAAGTLVRSSAVRPRRARA